MAVTLKLVWRYTEVDYSILTPVTDIDELDLLNYLDGFKLADSGWVPQTAKEGDKSVIEVLTFRAKGATNDDLAAVIQALDLFKKRAAWSREQLVNRVVVLRAAMEQESQTREAMILNLEYELKTSPYDEPYAAQSLVNELVLTVTRTPAWEPREYFTTRTNSDLLALSCDGGLAAVSHIVGGDVPARIERLAVYSDDTYAFGQMWLGWRTNRFGLDPSKFQPVWDLTSINSGGLGADTSVSGDHLVTTFATTPTLATRATALVQDFSGADSEHQWGKFMVLLRASVSSAVGVVRARMVYGASAPAYVINNPIYRDRVIVNSTTPLLYEMGQASLKTISGSIARASISIQAERLSGAASLNLYELILIPIDEGALAFRSTTGIDNQDYAAVYHRINNELIGYNVHGAYGLPDRDVGNSLSLKPQPWSMPANDVAPTLVFAAQGLTGHDPTKTVTVEYTVAHRWSTLRGNDS